MIKESSLISKEVLLESHHIFSCVEKGKLHAQAFCTIWVSVLIIIHFYLERKREVGPLDSPIWKTLTTELAIK